MKNLQYSFLDPSMVKPHGWLSEQLKLQANGLCGNLDKIWPDIKDSAWIGGTCEGWERVPYWLDGFIPMAYLLEDQDMIDRAKKYIDAIVSRQCEDGWLCPCTTEERANYDTWATLLILKVLTVYADFSKDARIEEVVTRGLKNLDAHLDAQSLRNWGAARWFEGLIPILWLYQRTEAPWLLSLAGKLKAQGFDWNHIFASCQLEAAVQSDRWNYISHVVNVAMALKSEALASVLGLEAADDFAQKALTHLLEHHGNAVGYFNGDECLSSSSPIQGTELCGVVEAMYSYEWLFAITGETKWLDQLERLAFNALPAAISPDMWSHQYDQMANQVAAFPMSKQPFHTNTRDAHIFGLEPNFGCCTANFGQGFSKLALSAFMRSEDGIASCALLPSHVTTKIDHATVTCALDTGYPFRGALTYQITTDCPIEFTFSIRIPSWATQATVNGRSVPCGAFYPIRREWNGTETITVLLEFSTRLVPRPHDMVSVWHGPLLFASEIGATWEKVEYTQDGVERKFPYCDYYIYPTEKWSFALTSDHFTLTEHDFVSGFGNEVPPVTLEADAAEIPWGFHCGHCDPQPTSRTPIGPNEKIKLIPYGCSTLRLTEFPMADK